MSFHNESLIAPCSQLRPPKFRVWSAWAGRESHPSLMDRPFTCILLRVHSSTHGEWHGYFRNLTPVFACNESHLCLRFKHVVTSISARLDTSRCCSTFDAGTFTRKMSAPTGAHRSYPDTFDRSFMCTASASDTSARLSQIMACVRIAF